MQTTSQPAPAHRTRFTRILQRLLFIVLCPYLAAVGLTFVNQRSLIYHPRTNSQLNTSPPRIGGCHLTALACPVESWPDLRGWLLKPSTGERERSQPAPPRPVIIYFCGNAGNRGDRLDDFALLLDAGADVVCFDYRGFGDNPGQPTEETLAADAQSIVKYLRQTPGIAGREMVLFGESLGGGVATRLAAELSRAGAPPDGLILRSTFSRLEDAAAFHFPWLPVHWLLWDRFDSLKHIEQVTCPVLILHGDRDTIVPIEQGRSLLQAAPPRSSAGIRPQFVILAGADHNDVLMEAGPTLVDAIRDFLQNTQTAATRNTPSK